MGCFILISFLRSPPVTSSRLTSRAQSTKHNSSSHRMHNKHLLIMSPSTHAEEVLREQCKDVRVRYEEAPLNESRSDRSNRRRRLRRSILRVRSSPYYKVSNKIQLEETPIITDVGSMNIKLSSSPMHNNYPSYVYIHQMKTGSHNITKTSKTTRRGQLGDLHRIRRQINIHPSERFMYSTSNDSSLRKCPHGSALVSNKHRVDGILKRRGVQYIDISKSTACGGIYEDNGVRVVYDNNELMEQTKNIEFEKALINHFLDNYQQRDSEKKNKNRDATNSLSRCDGGFQSRYPADRVGITKTVKGEKVPVMKSEKFQNLPHDVLEHIFRVILPLGQKFLDESAEGGSSYKDNDRFLQFAKQFNVECGYAEAKTRFEYIDIMVNKVGKYQKPLMRHIDGKNCKRPGYSGTVVYSFHKEVKGNLYKCSIVMASRTVCGAAMERIRE